MLLACGAVQWQQWLRLRRSQLRRAGWIAAFALVACGAIVLRVCLPLAPVNSAHWNLITSFNGDFVEEFGWPELAQETARIWNALTPEERAHAGIWASNYGEAGALELYGPALGLPRPWSAVNSFWLRGPYGQTPQTLIVIGSDREDLDQPCTTVELVGHTGNAAGVSNEETRWHPDIFLCRGVRKPLEKLWPTLREFG